LQSAVVGGEANIAKMDDRMRHAARTLVVGEVVITPEEVVDSVERDRNNKVVVVGEGDS